MSAPDREVGLIAVAGEALMDLVPAGSDGRYQAVPGGSPANVAVGLARLAVPVRLLARIGSDPFAHRLRKYLQDNDVRLDCAVQAVERTSLSIVYVDADGTARYDFQIDGTADWQWTDSELDGALDGGVVALHVGSLAAMLPPGAAVIQRLAVRARSAVTVSFDPNTRRQLMLRARARERVETMLPLTDVVKASEEDLAWLYPQRSPEAVLRDWITRGPALVVITLGSEGCLAATTAAPERIHVPGRRIEVVDTIGAGDAFTSGLLAGLRDRDLLGAARRDALRTMTEPDLTAVLDQAVLISAITCTRSGADPPSAAELRGRRV
ncbi:carbohydrate kinase [Nocardia sp. NPDC051911]|uniref:carbohydrate kinase family protein n=1 Tax=unclassified Nocardia TaxID=2637762 RepID=UPI00341C3000